MKISEANNAMKQKKKRLEKNRKINKFNRLKHWRRRSKDKF